MCTLPYPDRFYAGVAFAASPPPTARGVTDETRLLLYALFQQATEGPCMHSKPWGWNVVESAKWTAWTQLANLPLAEAMRLYVRTLEDENPNWWQLATEDGDPAKVQSIMQAAAAAAAASAPAAFKAAAAASALGPWKAQHLLHSSSSADPHHPDDAVDDARGLLPLHAVRHAATGVNMWTAPAVKGKPPAPRYDHAAVALDGKMFVVGGNARGKLLADTAVLDLTTLSWAARPQPGGSSSVPMGAAATDAMAAAAAALPACAAHAVVVCRGQVLAVGGRTAPGGTRVNSRAPPPPLEVHTLDRASMLWVKLEPTGPPPMARGGHTATVVGGKLWVFGGEGADRRLKNDTHCLDVETMEWRHVAATGAVPEARSRHVACAVGGAHLLLFGGGSAARCCTGLHLLDVNTGLWTTPACEGAMPPARSGAAAARLGGCWYISGGGDHAAAMTDTLVLEVRAPHEGAMRWLAAVPVPLSTSLVSEGHTLVPVEAAGALLAFGGYNDRYHSSVFVLRPVFGSMSAPAVVAAPAPPVDTAAVEATTHELQLMRRQLASAQAAQAAAEAEAAAARAAADAEQTRSFQLEVQISELKQQLDSMAALEKEVEVMRKRELAMMEATKSKPNLWGYISGSDHAPSAAP